MTEPGLYRHFKGGRYRVLGVARHSETEEPFVVYHPEERPESLWIRPLGMFEELVEREGRRIPRFERIGE